jgi:hypothetical protein
VSHDKPFKRARSDWTEVVLVCRKCSKKLDGGFGEDGDEKLAKVLRKSVKAKGGGKGRKAADAAPRPGRCLIGWAWRWMVLPLWGRRREAPVGGMVKRRPYAWSSPYNSPSVGRADTSSTGGGLKYIRVILTP